jgi:hypothetical protein
MEASMAEQSSVHVYLNWAKERIDEMDAALASIETKASQLKADAKAKAEQLVTDLKNDAMIFAVSRRRLKQTKPPGNAPRRN